MLPLSWIRVPRSQAWTDPHPARVEGALTWELGEHGLGTELDFPPDFPRGGRAVWITPCAPAQPWGHRGHVAALREEHKTRAEIR